MKLKRTPLFFALIALFISNVSLAKVVQILHTNDMHGFFDHYEHSPDKGGYGAVKTVIDKYKNWGADEGIETIYVDAGDFGEGHLFYNAQDGRRNFKMLQDLGVDIGVLGNHDYLMGTDTLDDIFADVGLTLPMLGANVHIDEKYTNIHDNIVPYVTKKFGDIKVAFMGVTTDSVLYTWRINDGEVSDPVKTGKKWAKKLSKSHDFVISVNHVGVKTDMKLAKKANKYLDLVIGGHSHTTLKTPEWIKGNKGKKIPVVQAGKHGKYVGRIIVDLVKGEHLKILKYELVPVENVIKDQVIEQIIADSNDDLNEKFGQEWLESTVGFSELPVTDDNEIDESDRIFQNFIVDSFKESVGADISINAANLAGGNYPVGPVNRRDIINAYPRMFDFEDWMGWRVYTAEIKGQWIRTLMKWVMFLGYDHTLYISGLDFKYVWKSKKRAIIRKLRINGKKVYPHKSYKVALPEGIVRGGFGITKLTGLLLKKSKRTDKTIWSALEDKFQRDGSVGLDYLNNQEFKAFMNGEVDSRMQMNPVESELEKISSDESIEIEFQD